MKKSRKVSFRVATEVSEGLKLVAEIAEVEDMAISDLVRSCVNYGLTRDSHHLPKYLRDGSYYGEFPTLENVEGWRELIEEVLGPGSISDEI